MNIHILGSGCSKCTKLYEAAKAAAERSGKVYTIKKVQNINDVIAAGVMVTPAMMVNGELKVSGKIPDDAALDAMLA